MSDAEFPFPAELLQQALRTAGNSEAARNKELVTGFATTTPYDREQLSAAAANGHTVWISSAGTGALYGIKLNNDFAEDGSVTGSLTHINGQPASERWWRTMMVNPGYDGVKQTFRPADDDTIAVTPGRRGVA